MVGSVSFFGYGRCPCSGHYASKQVEVRMTVAGTNVVMEGVPQGECPLCGSRVYKAAVLDCIEALMRGQRGAGPFTTPAPP